MTLPDFREPFLIEINQARQLNAAANAILPYVNGGDKKTDLAAALAHIALEHIAAILALFEGGAIASGYALMRPALETTYKCVWIAAVADDKKVAQAYKGRAIYGDLSKVIKDIEAEFADTDWATLFGKIKLHVRVLHERTHSGGEQTLRGLRAEDMRTPEYDFTEIIRDVRTLAASSILVVTPIVTPADVEELNILMLSNYSWLRRQPSNEEKTS